MTPPFFRKAVAKVRSFSHILQFFAELFSKFFFGARLRGSLLKSGCKGKELFSNYQMFCEVFFRKFFESLPEEGNRPLGPLLRKAGPENQGTTGRQPAKHMHCNSMSSITASFPKAGAKVRLISGSANLYRLFFHIFLSVLCKLLIYKYVLQQVFEEKKKGKEEDTHYIYFAGARERKTMI